ncbi:unnamed protein product, partial [Meganyctiphanes norvegica]
MGIRACIPQWIFGGLALGQDQQLPCVPQMFDQDSVVCVCNATYCDTLPQPVIPPTGDALVYTSDLTGKRFDMTVEHFQPMHTESSESIHFVVSADDEYQPIKGWGGAFTDAAAANILSLSPEAQDMLLSAYFTSTGLEYNIGRVNMGGCDFSWRHYTYDDVEGDIDLTMFQLAPEDTDYKIPVIHRAKAMSSRPVELFASPWSAPIWMKTNHNDSGFGQLKEEMYQPWANYFVKFLDSYSDYDLTFFGMTAQNEPIDGYVPGFAFNCMGWTADEQRQWIAENLGPTMKEAGYSDVDIMILDDQRFNLPGWAETVLGDPDAEQYVSGIGVHWYGDNYSPAGLLDNTNELFPDKYIIMTEACEGSYPWQTAVTLGRWERLESYARNIITDMNHWVTGWVDWNLALDMEGGPNWEGNFVDAPIIVNKESDEFYKNPMYYALGHFSKFVRPGAKRVGLNPTHQSHMHATAFKNTDNSIAVVILNSSEETLDMILEETAHGQLTIQASPRSLQTIIFQ